MKGHARLPLWRKQDPIRVAVVLWLLGCWFLGASRSDVDVDPFLVKAWPEANHFERLDGDVQRAVDADGNLLGYVAVGTASGYGGPMRVAVSMTSAGEVQSVAVVEHRESPSFFQKVLRARFLRGLVGKTYEDRILLGDDVDAVTGATYTSLGLTQSVHRAARTIAQDQLELSVPSIERKVVFGPPEMLLILLFSIGVLRRKVPRFKNQLRWLALVLGLVFLGFVYNSSFVLAHINMVLIGYWPEWQTHLFWYLLIIGLLCFKAKKEWNVYCYDFCPFGAAQEVLAKIGGARPRRLRWPKVLLWSQRIICLAAISLALIFRNPGLTSFEIFGTAFNLEGSNFQFALLAIIVLASLFIYRPWCRYLCPLHKNTTEGLFDNTRRIVRTLWQKIGSRLRPA